MSRTVLMASLLLALLGGLLRPALASEPPKRIVALTWEATEHLLQLDVKPLAIADVNDYRQWMVRPTLPADTLSVGSRSEPNLELLAELKPDLLVISPLLEDLRSRLERIAPVLSFDSFRSDHDNYQSARDNYLALARRLDREALARQRLAQMDQRIAAQRARVQAHFRGHPPEVAVVRFSTPTVVYLYGDNSMPQFALDLLGLRSAWPQPATAWGIIQKPITDLGRLRDAVVLYIQPFDREAQLFATPLWHAMPFVRAQHFGAMRSTWTYGGVFSVEYLVEALADALIAVDERASASPRSPLAAPQAARP